MTPSPHLTLVVVAAALTVQCFAVAAALRLLVITRHGWAWGCVSVALLLMAIRRGLTLRQGVGEAHAHQVPVHAPALGRDHTRPAMRGLDPATRSDAWRRCEAGPSA